MGVYVGVIVGVGVINAWANSNASSTVAKTRSTDSCVDVVSPSTATRYTTEVTTSPSAFVLITPLTWVISPALIESSLVTTT